MAGRRFASWAERFETIGHVLKSGILGRTIPTGTGNPGKSPGKSHAVHSEACDHTPGHPTRQALDEFLAQFAGELPR